MNSHRTERIVVLTIMAVGAVIWAGLFYLGWERVPEMMQSLETLEQDVSLEASSASMNADLPMMVDDETRLDTTAATGEEFHYYYTLVNRGAGSMDAAKFVATMRPHLHQVVCTNPEMRKFLGPDISAVYIYRINDGSVLATLRVRPSDCE